MSKSLEDVIISINHVKNKKCEGTLYLLSERLTWMPAAKKTFTISYNYEDIKSQKVSLESKEKVQLQVVLCVNGASTFHFNNPEGRDSQTKERDTVKEKLQILLAKFKKKANTELEDKTRKLQEDPKQYLLYINLVTSGVVTPEEFWATHYNAFNTDIFKQEAGVSASFLSDVESNSNGCNGINYNLTFDIMQSIFKTYPAVKKKHADYVPDKISEQDFWSQFFQSHYFHRDRINVSEKDFFSDCAKNDEQYLQKELDNSLDFTRTTKLFEKSTEESYNSSLDMAKVESIPANASLIKRFNQHSTMVLKASKKCETQDNIIKNGTAGIELNLNKGSAHRIDTEYLEMEPLEDLDSNAPSLKLSRIDAYLHGPTPLEHTKYKTPDELYRATQALTHEVMAWKNKTSNLMLANNDAINVILELAPTSNLMQSSKEQSSAEMLSKEIQSDLKAIYLAQAELLRHFWACFPVTSNDLQEKLERMHECLQRFYSNKITPLSDKILQQHLPSDLINHTISLNQQAMQKFNIWQQKKPLLKKM